jgi:hypothetical protein
MESPVSFYSVFSAVVLVCNAMLRLKSWKARSRIQKFGENAKRQEKSEKRALLGAQKEESFASEAPVARRTAPRRAHYCASEHLNSWECILRLNLMMTPDRVSLFSPAFYYFEFRFFAKRFLFFLQKISFLFFRFLRRSNGGINSTKFEAVKKLFKDFNRHADLNCYKTADIQI